MDCFACNDTSISSFNPNKTGIFQGSFSWVGGGAVLLTPLPSPLHISRRTADIFCCKLTLFFSLSQGSVKNQKNWWKSIKIANIDGEILYIFWTTKGISMKFSGKMWIVIMLKVTKKQVFTLCLSNTFL